MCSSDYQDEQDDENYRVTLGADISNTTTDRVFSHSLQLSVRLFKGEQFPWGRNGVRNFLSFCSVCKLVVLIKSFLCVHMEVGYLVNIKLAKNC